MRQRGITMIEVLIVMTIVAILAAFAIPAYKKQFIDGRRADGIQIIQEVMSAQERFFVTQSSAFTYTADLTDLGYASAANVESDRGYYKVSASACGAGIVSCVVVTAVPQDAQAEDGNLTLNSRGTRTGNWPGDPQTVVGGGS